MMIVDRGLVAKLRITPAGPYCQIVETFTLRQVGSEWIVRYASRDRITGEATRKSRKPEANHVTAQLAQLQSATIPVVLKAAMPCDGELVEVTIYGDTATLSVTWWTIVPDGAEALGRLVAWLRRVCA